MIQTLTARSADVTYARHERKIARQLTAARALARTLDNQTRDQQIDRLAQRQPSCHSEHQSLSDTLSHLIVMLHAEAGHWGSVPERRRPRTGPSRGMNDLPPALAGGRVAVTASRPRRAGRRDGGRPPVCTQRSFSHRRDPTAPGSPAAARYTTPAELQKVPEHVRCRITRQPHRTLGRHPAH